MIAIKPNDPAAYSNLGISLAALGKHGEAVTAFRQAVAFNPNFVEAYWQLANALRHLGRLDEAVACTQRVIAINPNDPAAHSNLGISLAALGKFDEAVGSCRHAITIEPDYANAHINLGVALAGLGKLDEALTSYDRALALQPDFAEAFNNRGNVLRQLKRFDEALASYDKALALKPEHPHAFNGIVDCVNKLCDWRRKTNVVCDVTAHVSEKKSIIDPFTLLGYSGDPALQLKCARNFIENNVPLLPRPLWTGETRHHDKLRVAYLSADFRDHAVSYLMAGLFEQHDRARFEIFAISFGPDSSSEMRSRLDGAFDRIDRCARDERSCCGKSVT